MKAVYKRELASYFNSMIGYVYAFIVLLFIGIFFWWVNLVPSSGQAGSYPYFAGALSSAIIIMVFAVPILTMKSIADERRLKTDQMLLTYPVKASSVILGKYTALLTVYALPLLVACLCPLVISWGSAGGGSYIIDYSMILALLCYGAMLVAIGMFISSLTESQIIAAVASMGIFLLLFFWGNLVSLIPETALSSLIGFLVLVALIVAVLYGLTRSWIFAAIVGAAGAVGLTVFYFAAGSLLAGALNKVLGVFAVTEGLNNFASYNVFDVKALLLYLSVTALFIFLTVQSVQKRRWS